MTIAAEHRTFRCLRFINGTANLVYTTLAECTQGNINVAVTFTQCPQDEPGCECYMVICRREVRCIRRDYTDWLHHVHYRTVPYVRQTRHCEFDWRFADVTIIKYTDDTFTETRDISPRDTVVTDFRYTFSDELKAMVGY